LFPIKVEGEREHVEGKKRWAEINVNIDPKQTKALWLLLEEFQNVFV
jgi:hypothetical protein